jgi:hypothetical protein
MTKPTADMDKRELAQALSPIPASIAWYMANMTKDQLREQVEYQRGERTQEQLTYRYDH